jgi:hypothetical protein
VNPEGRIEIRLTRRGDDASVAVSIQSSRPQLAQQLFAGRTPAAVADLASLIFSLCGKAQRSAAQAACEAAQGLRPDAATLHAREQAVLIELAQEHAWRLLLDWPQQAGVAADMPSLLKLRQSAGESARFSATLATLLRDVMLGEPAADWLARDLAGFDAWRLAAKTPLARLFAGLGEGADIGISQVALLPPLHRLADAAARDLARQALANPAFCMRPLWRDAPAETGALARISAHPLLAAWIAQRGRGAGARLLARLLELAMLPAQLAETGPALVRAWPLEAECGMAGIETSRGLLLHVVQLCAGKVAEYRIVAPTEWNFHPAGALRQALTDLPPGGDAPARARLICQSLDPCVAFDVVVSPV